jgi:hypothetical protein
VFWLGISPIGWIAIAGNVKIASKKLAERREANMFLIEFIVSDVSMTIMEGIKVDLSLSTNFQPFLVNFAGRYLRR